MDKYGPPTDDQGWIEIINRLRAFAEDQITIYTWFRSPNALPHGLTAEDFTQEAIFRYLENPSLYHPTKGTFLGFLKFYILRRLVYNLSKEFENRRTVDVEKFPISDDDNSDINYEDYLPGTIPDIEDNLDFEKIANLIIEKIHGETILENIFEGIFFNNLKRREICQQYNIADQDYDNAVRRLNTIIKTVKFQIR